MKKAETLRDEEAMLIALLKLVKDKNDQATLLQGYIQHYGPLSNECGDIVRELLKK